MKTWKSKKVFGSCVHCSFVYISCAFFFSVSSIRQTYEKNLLIGLHDFKSFLSFRCLFMPGAIKRRATRFVCISCHLLYYAFICLSIFFSFSFVRPRVLPISICAIHEFCARSWLSLFFAFFFSCTLSFSFYHYFFSFFFFLDWIGYNDIHRIALCIENMNSSPISSFFVLRAHVHLLFARNIYP